MTAPLTVTAPTVAATAAQLIRDGKCTAQCLCAASTVAEDASCGCPCKGTHHGVLGAMPVVGTRRQRPAERVDEPALFDVLEVV